MMNRFIKLAGLCAILLFCGGFWKLSNDARFGQLGDYTGQTTSHTGRTNADRNWVWNATRDRDSHSLLDSQCQAAFPLLYKEIDRARAFWDERLGGTKIAPGNIDLDWSFDGGLRAMIYNQQLFVVYSRGLNHFHHWKQRSHATLHQIHRAIMSSPEPVPNIEFSIKINDKIGVDRMHWNTTLWSFTRNQTDPRYEQVWIVPDFNFWNYIGVAGSFSDFQHKVIDADDLMVNKKSSLVWRGTTAFNPTVREKLLEQTKGRPWSDVRKVDEDSASKYRLSMTDHCQYKFAVHTEGTTWSGRLKYLLSCHSVAVVHDLTWFTHLYHLLVPSGPDQNYVQVSKQWINLPGKIEYLLEDDVEAQRIADNAAATFRDRYITPAAQTCYWRRLFLTWSEVSFEPDPYEMVEMADGKMVRQWRGMSFEDYIFWDGNVPNDAH